MTSLIVPALRLKIYLLPDEMVRLAWIQIIGPMEGQIDRHEPGEVDVGPGHEPAVQIVNRHQQEKDAQRKNAGMARAVR